MAARDLFLPVAAQESLDWFAEYVTRGESLGYEFVWMPETWGRDVVTVLSRIADRTDRIGIGTSIANVYSRSPALLGQTAVTLQEASGGRFRLGLGASGPILIEGWHGVDYDRPLRRTREAIEIVRQVQTGEELRYDGDIFNLAGFRLRHDPPETPVPLDAAGMSPKSVELAGRFGDGWHALMLDRDGLSGRLEDFERGTELGNRNRDDQRVTLSLTCCALADRERARHLVRGHLVFYVGAMGTFYRDALARQGYEEAANTISQRVGSGDTDAAMDALTDDLLDAFAIAGTPEECRDRLAAFESLDGVDAVSVSFPRGASKTEVETTIDALAP